MEQKDGYSSSVYRVTQVAGLVEHSVFNEGTTKSCSTGNNDGSLTLAKGSNQVLDKINVSIPGAIGDVKIKFYDNTVATGDNITGDMYLSAQPSNGFDLSGLKISSGKVGFRISGISSGTHTAYVNLRYAYE